MKIINNFGRKYNPDKKKFENKKAFIFDSIEENKQWRKKHIKANKDKKNFLKSWKALGQPYELILGLELQNIYHGNMGYLNLKVYLDVAYGDIWYKINDGELVSQKTEYPLEIGDVMIFENESWGIEKFKNKKDLFTAYKRIN